MKTTTIIDDGDMDPYPPDHYTGIWISLWPNGQMKFRGMYINGQEEGEHVCYWENGTIAQEGKCTGGTCVGLWKDYWDDGSLYKTTEYFSKGDFIVTWYDTDGTIDRLKIFKDGMES